MTIGRCQAALRELYDKFPDEESFIANMNQATVDKMIGLFEEIITAKKNIGDDCTEELNCINDLRNYGIKTNI